MTTEPNDAPAAHEPDTTEAAAAAAAAATAAAHREAYQYWGYLIKSDKCGTDKLDRLLKSLAEVISTQFSPTDSPDITPSQLADFYRAVGGNYDVLFIETPPSSLSFIYRSLGAFHSLQPAPDDDGYSAPAIPALKHRGFVTWQTVQLLLGPEEHVPFLQNAVAKFDVVDPETGNLFPKLLPKECFPDRPDDAMETWYEGVAQRLKKEAEEDAAEKVAASHVRIEVEEGVPRTSSEISGESTDERHGAARYFDDPMYRKERTRPPIVRHFSKQPRAYVEERGRQVASSVRHMLNPFNRRKSVPDRHDEEDYSDEGAIPMAPVPQALRHSHKRPHPPRREDTLSTTDSESDSDGPPSRHRTPVLRHRRSHDPPTSAREYFPRYEERRYSHDIAPDPRKPDGPPPLYGPTKSPLFATQVAHLQAHNYYDRRPAMPARTSYRPPANVRYVGKPASPRDAVELPYVREHPEPPYMRDRERDRSREPITPRSSHHHHRRRSEEYPREHNISPRERSNSGRTTRSRDRLKDEWDERDRSDRSKERSQSNRDRDRDRDRERERDRERDGVRARTHRYVAGVLQQDGVGGRRYPVEQLRR